MRKRTLAPRRGTRLPNAVPLGYRKTTAYPGDYVLITAGRGGQRPSFGRVLGQIASCDADGENVQGWLAVAVLSADLTLGYERWVPPEEVSECMAAEHVQRFMTAFLAADVATTLAALEVNEGVLAVDTESGALWTRGLK